MALLLGTVTPLVVIPGGVLLMIGHALRNLTEGVGGPQQPDVLWEPERFSKELAELGLEVDRAVVILYLHLPEAEERIRPVEGKGDAVDIPHLRAPPGCLISSTEWLTFN